MCVNVCLFSFLLLPATQHMHTHIHAHTLSLYGNTREKGVSVLCSLHLLTVSCMLTECCTNFGIRDEGALFDFMMYVSGNVCKHNVLPPTQ
mmetsp:Transcript_3984/g.5958  ORF Transcript_3984/g.5958 Transcript_3984/m.5958 type:complete len:91 (-) Transcript_3984:56-328(-)